MPITGVAGLPTMASYDPMLYLPELKKRFRDATLINRITNAEFKGKFKNRGTEVKVRCLPLLTTTSRRRGEVVTYQEPEAFDETFKIDRERTIALKTNSEDEMFTDIDAWATKTMQDGGLQMALDIEREFHEDIGSKCHVKNQGNTAGAESESYVLGTAAAPLSIYKTDTQVAASVAAQKNNAIDFIAESAATLSEQPGGDDADPWILLPTWMSTKLITSELHKANEMGDSVSMLRKGIQFMGELAGMRIYTTNLLTKIASTEALPTRFQVLFGDNSAITFADEATLSERLQDVKHWGQFHRSLMIYDWFVRYSERFGTAIVTRGL